METKGRRPSEPKWGKGLETRKPGKPDLMNLVLGFWKSHGRRCKRRESGVGLRAAGAAGVMLKHSILFRKQLRNAAKS